MTNISEYAKICKDTHVTGEDITNFDSRLYQDRNEIVSRVQFFAPNIVK